MAMALEDDVGLMDPEGNNAIIIDEGEEEQSYDETGLLSGEEKEGEGEGEEPVVVTNNSAIRSMLLSLIGENDSPQSLIVGLIMVVLILVSVFSFFPESTRKTNLPGIVLGIDVIATVAFLVEYFVRLAASPNIRVYVLSSAGIVNVLSFVPLFIEAMVKSGAEGESLIRGVRFLRVLRMVRFMKLFQYGFLFKRIIPFKQITESRHFAFFAKHKEFFDHMWHETMEQLKAVVPISVYAILFQYIVLGLVVGNLGIIFGGLVCVIVSLYLFLEGLRLSIMPLGEYVSMMLPRHMRVIFVMLAAFVLGIIVTYAEPAIGALAILGALVPKERAPYLAFLLSEWTQPLTLFVGIGVGLAAAVGVLRVKFNWTLKKVIFISMIPCIIMTFICAKLIPELDVVIGLAWDCGAVTTGPVTVPVVLALGSGVANAMNSGNADNIASSTFGIVTLASLFPIVTVQLLAVIAYFYVSPEELAAGSGISEDGILEKTPYRETINGIRAIVPAVAFFFLLGRFVLKHKIPELILRSVSPPSEKEIAAEYEMSPRFELGSEILEEIPDDDESEGPRATPQGKQKKKIRMFYFGVAAALFGMILFNYGITFGLAELGEQVGTALPGTYHEVDIVPGSPQYSTNFGIFLVGLFALVLGYLCTQAEPGLIVFGEKVEQLQIMPKKTLVVSVALGVAMGMTAGVVKIMYNLNFIWFILVGYIIALVMTFFSDEQIVCVAWDSAGVTTGEITVSFILVLGASLSKASNSTEGFGILTMASVGPIISVLAAGFLVRFKRYLAGRNTF